MQYLANNKRLDKQYKQRKKCYTWQNLYIHKLHWLHDNTKEFEMIESEINNMIKQI